MDHRPKCEMQTYKVNIKKQKKAKYESYNYH